jgi:tRNA-2-methylthio-N6-dimethylallyladenosine synthase
MVILNTCHIREKAAEKLYSDLGRLREHKIRRSANGNEMIIVVAGCVAQAEGKEVISRAPYVDIVVGPQSYQTLPDLLSRLKRDNKPAIELEFPVISKFDSMPEKRSNSSVSAFLSIQEGCDKFCSFCVVPYTRGAEFSRPVAEIYREALQLVSNGARELNLLGQNVNAYHGESLDGEIWGLGKLLRHLAKISGLERLRYTTSHPRDIDESLLSAHAEEAKLMPFMHLPVQSGSDRILQKMNRKHTRDFYFQKISDLRKARQDIAFSSDFIVGFPGETEQDFQDTLDLIKQVKFAQSYSFKYSPRPGTPAAESEDQIAEEVKAERLQILQALLNEQLREFNQASLGKIMPVLFDRPGKKPGQIQGKSPYLQAVYIEGDASMYGTIQNVEITGLSSYSLAGKLA